MANNRLYIYDPETKRAAMLAKNMSDGWYVFNDDSKNDRIARKLDIFFESLESNKGWGDYEGTDLCLMVEGQLPEDASIVNTPSLTRWQRLKNCWQALLSN